MTTEEGGIHILCSSENRNIVLQWITTQFAFIFTCCYSLYSLDSGGLELQLGFINILDMKLFRKIWPLKVCMLLYIVERKSKWDALQQDHPQNLSV